MKAETHFRTTYIARNAAKLVLGINRNTYIKPVAFHVHPQTLLDLREARIAEFISELDHYALVGLPDVPVKGNAFLAGNEIQMTVGCK